MKENYKNEKCCCVVSAQLYRQPAYTWGLKELELSGLSMDVFPYLIHLPKEPTGLSRINFCFLVCFPLMLLKNHKMYALFQLFLSILISWQASFQNRH